MTHSDRMNATKFGKEARDDIGKKITKKILQNVTYIKKFEIVLTQLTNCIKCR